jgi:hypothetical protein
MCSGCIFMNIRVDVQEVFAAVFWIGRLFLTQLFVL